MPETLMTHCEHSVTMPRARAGSEGAALLVKATSVIMLGAITLGATSDGVVSLFVAVAYLTALTCAAVLLGGDPVYSQRNIRPSVRSRTMHQ